MDTKPYSVRLSAETKERIELLVNGLKEQGLNSDSAFCEILKMYELATLQDQQPGLSDLIRQYEAHSDAIKDLIIDLIGLNNDAELRISQKFKDQLFKQNENNESLSNTIVNLQKQIKELELVIDDKDGELEKLVAEIEVKNKIETANSQNIELLKSNISDLKNELSDGSDIIDGLHTDINNIKNELSLKKEELAQSKKECEMLHIDKCSNNEQINKLKKSIDELHEENSRMYQINNENDVLKKTIKDKDSIIRNKENSIVNLTQSLVLERNNNEHLTERVDEFKIRIEELKNELNSVKEELKEARKIKEKEEVKEEE